MNNPFQTGALHPTQVHLKNLPVEVVKNLRELTHSDPPRIMTIEESTPWVALTLGICGLFASGVYIDYKGMDFISRVGWILPAIIGSVSLFTLIVGISRAIDLARSPMRPGLYLAPSHVLIVRNGVITCLARSRIRYLRLKVDSYSAEFVLEDGATFDYEILASHARPIEDWLQRSRGVDEDWPGELFLDWQPETSCAPPARTENAQGESEAPSSPRGPGEGAPPRRHRIATLSRKRASISAKSGQGAEGWTQVSLPLSVQLRENRDPGTGMPVLSLGRRVRWRSPRNFHGRNRHCGFPCAPPLDSERYRLPIPVAGATGSLCGFPSPLPGDPGRDRGLRIAGTSRCPRDPIRDRIVSRHGGDARGPWGGVDDLGPGSPIRLPARTALADDFRSEGPGRIAPERGSGSLGGSGRVRDAR